MYKVYIGGYDCNEELIRENNWTPDGTFSTLVEAFELIEDELMYDDVAFIEFPDGKLRYFLEEDIVNEYLQNRRRTGTFL